MNAAVACLLPFAIAACDPGAQQWRVSWEDGRDARRAGPYGSLDDARDGMAAACEADGIRGYQLLEAEDDGRDVAQAFRVGSTTIATSRHRAAIEVTYRCGTKRTESRP
jgi:hypothetical protein